MSLYFSKELIEYQNNCEAGIKELTKEWDEPESELAQRLLEAERVTSEDLSRRYSPEDVRQLCLRTKVHVDMTLFNCVWEAKKRFDKKERLKNHSKNFINKMYIKAVKRKMVIPYEPKEIDTAVNIRRCILKKRNNLRLDRWNSLSSQVSSTSLSIEEISEDQDPSLMLSQIPNQLPSSPNGSRVAPVNTIIYPVDVTSSAPNSSEPQLWHVGNTESEILQLSTIAENEDNMSEMAELAINDESNEVQETKENIFDKSGVDWATAAMGINPNSMTIDSDMQTPKTESEPIPEDYSSFNTQVPCTSTESTHNTDDFL